MQRHFAHCALLLALVDPSIGVADTARRPLPNPAEAPAGSALVVVALTDSRPSPAELGWALGHPREGDAAMVRRPLWRALAEAIATVPVPTADGLAEVRWVGDAQVLIATRIDGEAVLVTLLLPKEVLRPSSGRVTLGLDTDFSRERTATTELTTWPIAAFLEGWREPSLDRRLEGRIAAGRELVEERSRPAARDEDGDPIPFRDQPTDTLRDARSAEARGAWFATVSRGHSLGRLELGISLEAAWEQDRANLVESRLVSLLGGEWRASSEEVDDLWLAAALRLGATRSRYLVVEEQVDDGGVVVGHSETVEQHDLPVWQLELTGSAPLMRADGLTVILFEGSASWQQSFEGSGASEGRPDRLETIGVLELGLTVRTPIGAELGFGLALVHRELPGEAGERIDDLTWSTRAQAGLRIGF